MDNKYFKDSLLLFTKAGDKDDDLEDSFQETHPTVDHSLTLSHIRSVKQKILEVADLELSSVAIAYAFFEKLCLKGLVNKDNRKAKGAVCLFLATKVNEHKSKLTGMMDAFDRVFDLSDKDIHLVEFPTFAELEFSLYIPKSEFMPHLERILNASEYENIDEYVNWKNFYQ
ncbi:hypothetical protein K502DRAFT_330418 [Neoconidiobolus thromboides FSU 785]|nr:hypothetical protein K502DRAFT_330418 [Neoconidiobolus thromboides FSU 785]